MELTTNALSGNVVLPTTVTGSRIADMIGFGPLPTILYVKGFATATNVYLLQCVEKHRQEQEANLRTYLGTMLFLIHFDDSLFHSMSPENEALLPLLLKRLASMQASILCNI